jgi:hypothetical protein
MESVWGWEETWNEGEKAKKQSHGGREEILRRPSALKAWSNTNWLRVWGRF